MGTQIRTAAKMDLSLFTFGMETNFWEIFVGEKPMATEHITKL